MNYLPPPTTDIENPTRLLHLLGRLSRGYSSVFAEGRYAQRLSPTNPQRRVGFDQRLTVRESRNHGPDIRIISLGRADGKPLPRWTPGAHIDVFTQAGRQRHYSLTGDPADTSMYRIAVRRIPGGLGSTEMHETRVGDSLHIRGPRNAFNFAPRDEVLFIAGGIGITPILPMVRAAQIGGVSWKLIYTGRSRETMPFIDELMAIDPQRVEIRTDDVHGPPNARELMAADIGTSATYLCGPAALIDAARSIVAREQPGRELHTERFSPSPVIDGSPFRIEFASGGSVDVAADETALAAIRRVRPGIRYSCQQGFCGACRVKVLEGRVDHHDRVLIGDERENSMMICVSRALDDRLVVDIAESK